MSATWDRSFRPRLVAGALALVGLAACGGGGDAGTIHERAQGTGRAAGVVAQATVEAKMVQVRPHTGQMTCSRSFPEVCLTPGDGNDAIVKVVVPTKFSSIDLVCFTYHFAGDLVDPSDELASDGGGFSGGEAPQAERVLCFDYPDVTPRFLDGHVTWHVWMVRGSANITAVEVTVIGVPQ